MSLAVPRGRQRRDRPGHGGQLAVSPAALPALAAPVCEIEEEGVLFLLCLFCLGGVGFERWALCVCAVAF